MDISSLLSLEESNSFKPPKQSLPSLRPYGDSQSRITHHPAIRTEEKERRYKCMQPECQEIEPFTFIKHLKRHEKNTHQMHGGSKQYFCVVPTCRASQIPFNRKDNFTAHLNLHTETNTPKLTRRACDGCRGSKVKCSGGRPCDRCIRKNIPCTIIMNIGPSLGDKITTSKTSSPILQPFLYTQSLTSPNENYGRKRKASEISWASSPTLQSLPTRYIESDEDHRCKHSRSQSQNNLENEIRWDPKKKNRMARAYNKFRYEMWQKVAMEVGLPWTAVEAMAWKLGLQELSVRAHAPAGYILICSCGCDGFLPSGQENPAFDGALPAPVCYTCRHDLKAHNATFVKEIHMQVHFDERTMKPSVLTDWPTVTEHATRPSRIPPEPASKSPSCLQCSCSEFSADFNIAFHKMPSQCTCGHEKGSHGLGLKWISQATDSMLSTNSELVPNETASFPPANGNHGHFECFDEKITQKYKKGLDEGRG